jgi:hypothetical protein
MRLIGRPEALYFSFWVTSLLIEGLLAPQIIHRIKKPDIIASRMDHASEIRAEMELADASRAAGNEGRARVCARRAAGMAALDFLSRHQVKPEEAGQDRLRNNSAYVALQELATFPGLAPELKSAAIYLTMRVNTEFRLPNGIDLINEAHKLVGGLI